MSLTAEEREARKLMSYASEHRHPVYTRMARARKDYQLSRIKQNWPHGPLSEAEKLMQLIIRWVREDWSDEQIEAAVEARFKAESALHQQQNRATDAKRAKPTGGITADIASLLGQIEIAGGD